MLNVDDVVLRPARVAPAVVIATVAILLLTGGAYGLTERLAQDGQLTLVRSGTPRCTMTANLPAIRDSTATYLVGLARADTVLAGPGDIGRPLLKRREMPKVYGQVMHADTLEGVGADRVKRAFAKRASRDVVIVPWWYNPGCGTDFWTGSARWVAPDSLGLFSLRLRPDSEWVGGRPTFDALLAVIRSYVNGSEQLRRLAGSRLASDRALTPKEVFEIYMHLPARTNPPDTAAIARLGDWVRANPAIRARYPGNAMLDAWLPRSR